LLPLKVYQLDTLLQSFWISIDHSKCSSANYKAFLTNEGIKLIKARKEDFEFLFLMKKPDSFIFTSESNHDKMLRRERLTKDINKIMKSIPSLAPNQSNITSYSFRVGYLSNLWKDR